MESSSKEMETLAKAPGPQFSFKKVVLYFLLILVVYAIIIGFLILFPPSGMLNDGRGMGGALVDICDRIEGIIPIIAEIMLFFSIVFYTASRTVAARKKTLTEISIAMLFGFVFGILLAAVSRPFFSSFGLGC